MLYACVECGHQISSDAWRCPSCSCKDAGSRAEDAYYSARLRERELERDRTDPGWREREAAERAAASEYAGRDGTWTFIWVVYFLYLLPLLTVALPSLFFSSINWQIVIMAIPGINWLIFIVAVFSPHNQPALYVMGALAVIGAIVAAVTKPIKAQVY